MTNMSHDYLCMRAEKWLRNINCGVVFHDAFRAATCTGEQPDAIGWRAYVSFLIECKVSRSDFLADKKKLFRQSPDKGMGDWRFYLCPPDVIKVDDLPEGWGLLYCHPKKIEKVHGIPTNCNYQYKQPFKGYKEAEMQMMYSALRRMEIHGHLKDVYKKIGENQ